MSGRPERRRGSLGTRAPVIGLIGPIGCGKSTVAGWLAERGVAIIDSDQLTRRLMTPESPVTDEIFARFGAQFRLPNGELDRRALGRIVFSDSARLADLESIVHQAVARLEEESIRLADLGRPVAIVIEAIKLIEAGHASWCDEVWLIVCDPAIQLARLTARGMPEGDARQRIAAQTGSLQLWRSAATRIIHTDEDPVTVEGVVAAALAEVVPAGT